MIRFCCNCEFDYHCELGMECGCAACLVNDTFIRLKTWEEKKEAFRGMAARLGRKTCAFLSGLDYTPVGLSEVSSAEWNTIVTGNGVTKDDYDELDERLEYITTTIADVLSRFFALDNDERELAWQNINTFMHHVVADEQSRLERLASGGAR